MRPSIIEQTICQHIQKLNTIFIFPTQTAADLWADRATLVSQASAVAMERFIAWDQFKSTSIRSIHQTRTAIPQTLRTVFASRITSENAEKPIFKSIIAQPFAKQSAGFTSWISSLLPSLNIWKKRFEKSGMSADEEDSDFLTLHQRYTEFLDRYNLFDPAWETPPFKEDENKYIIFFPEILMDYLEYKPILESSKTITLIHVPPRTQETVVNKYANARIEIHQLAGTIRNLHEKEGIAWTDIAVDVPDLETYAPYLERDFVLQEIPFVRRNGKELTKTLAGSFFTSLSDCVQNNFSFESMRRLLTNNALPWKEQKLNQELIQFGKENNCICAFEKDGKLQDPWENAFKHPVNRLNELIKSYYLSLKKLSTAMVQAKTFDELRSKYFAFRDAFFDTEQWDPASNRIISRCISELRLLIDLENSYPDCTVPSPYSFFTEYLSGKMYVAQEENTGVQILPYRVACCAPFACHCVIDASQKSLSLVYRQLGFLNDTKREALGITQDPDVSDLYIQLYEMNSLNRAIFSVSEKTFDSYALEHSYFTGTTGIIQEDLLSQEKQTVQNPLNAKPLTAVTQHSHDSFTAWKNTLSDSPVKETNPAPEEITQNIEAHSYKNGKLRISQAALKNYFTCKRLWLLKSNLKVEEDVDEAQLTDAYADGNIRHAILHNFLVLLKQKNLPFRTENETIPALYDQLLQDCTHSTLELYEASALAKETLSNKKEAFYNELKQAVTVLCTRLEGCSVAETEKELIYEPEGKNYFFHGIIDCLARDDTDGEYILIDFKSSDYAIPKNKYAETDDDIPDFQMPMYRYLLSNQSTPIQADECVFFNLKKAEVKGIVGTRLLSSNAKSYIKDFESTQKRFLELSEQFAKEVTERPLDLAITNPEWNTCASCTFKAVCRRTFVIAKKED